MNTVSYFSIFANGQQRQKAIHTSIIKKKIDLTALEIKQCGSSRYISNLLFQVCIISHKIKKLIMELFDFFMQFRPAFWYEKINDVLINSVIIWSIRWSGISSISEISLYFVIPSVMTTYCIVYLRFKYVLQSCTKLLHIEFLYIFLPITWLWNIRVVYFSEVKNVSI